MKEHSCSECRHFDAVNYGCGAPLPVWAIQRITATPPFQLTRTAMMGGWKGHCDAFRRIPKEKPKPSHDSTRPQDSGVSLVEAFTQRLVRGFVESNEKDGAV
ncbi:MAG: hypothetical protein HN976_16505 [Lentisphaerae bacterium]|jgi:hypothetical protein|nr:hypothetical protein [Lentisphaerota bacterium]MBT7056693.1 hypothetical protein [Lentisphaerota bacterium]